MSWLVTNLRARSELDVALTVSGVDGSPFGRLPPELETALFRVAQEALAELSGRVNPLSVCFRYKLIGARIATGPGPTLFADWISDLGFGALRFSIFQMPRINR